MRTTSLPPVHQVSDKMINAGKRHKYTYDARVRADHCQFLPFRKIPGCLLFLSGTNPYTSIFRRWNLPNQTPTTPTSSSPLPSSAPRAEALVGGLGGGGRENKTRPLGMRNTRKPASCHIKNPRSPKNCHANELSEQPAPTNPSRDATIQQSRNSSSFPHPFAKPVKCVDCLAALLA